MMTFCPAPSPPASPDQNDDSFFVLDHHYRDTNGQRRVVLKPALIPASAPAPAVNHAAEKQRSLLGHLNTSVHIPPVNTIVRLPSPSPQEKENAPASIDEEAERKRALQTILAFLDERQQQQPRRAPRIPCPTVVLPHQPHQQYVIQPVARSHPYLQPQHPPHPPSRMNSSNSKCSDWTAVQSDDSRDAVIRASGGHPSPPPSPGRPFLPSDRSTVPAPAPVPLSHQWGPPSAPQVQPAKRQRHLDTAEDVASDQGRDQNEARARAALRHA
ncbi:hypothetical protein HK101_007011, partial [Irineochytrium annulatum]